MQAALRGTRAVRRTSRAGRSAAPRALAVRVSALSCNDLKNGTDIIVDGTPWRVTEFLHVKPGKGAAFVRTKLKSHINGTTKDATFRAGDKIEEADVTKSMMQLSYVDGNDSVFMDMESFEEERVPRDQGDYAKWVVEGTECLVLFWNGKVIGVDPPSSVDLVIAQTDPGVKGDTAQGGTKPATLETGAVVNVPLFVDEGESIKVDTRSGEYLSRNK